jgi:hypothetical protein
MKYKLQTKKSLDFIKFSKVIDMMVSKKYHLDLDGVIKIIDVACTMNRNDKQVALAIKNEIRRKLNGKDEEIVRSA